MKGAARPAHVAAALMELEAALRRSAFAPDWDAPPAGAAPVCAMPSQDATLRRSLFRHWMLGIKLHLLSC